MPDAIPDAMPDLKQWLKNLGVVGQRVFFRLPKRPSDTPFVRLSRMGGSPPPDAEVPLDEPHVSIQVWGLMDSDYDKVRRAATSIVEAIRKVNGPQAPVGSTTILWANALTSYDSPDPDTGWPRIIIQAAFGVRAAP